jgi:alpha-tubulin suppressor-like RCC1 family protein
MAWGYNGLGGLGIGITEDQDFPIAVNVPYGLRANQARSGPFSVAVNSAGQVYAWGEGEMGNGAFKSHLRPVRVRLPQGVKVTSARGGYQFAVALTTTGKVLTWGNGTSGQLGDGHNVNRDAPVWVKLPRGVTAVSACDDCAIALTSTGRVLAWGGNGDGQLGDGSTTDSGVPVSVHLPKLARIVAVAAGRYHSLALTRGGKILAWGDGSLGQLGDGSTSNKLLPVQIRVPGRVIAIGGGDDAEASLAVVTKIID